MGSKGPSTKKQEKCDQICADNIINKSGLRNNRQEIRRLYMYANSRREYTWIIVFYIL